MKIETKIKEKLGLDWKQWDKLKDEVMAGIACLFACLIGYLIYVFGLPLVFAIIVFILGLFLSFGISTIGQGYGGDVRRVPFIFGLCVTLFCSIKMYSYSKLDSFYSREAAREKAIEESKKNEAIDHANKVSRVKSGECKLVGPGQVTQSSEGRYPKLFFTNFVVYECKNGDVFKLPLE